MARYPGADAMYKVADLFRDRCLANELSLLWPDDEVWTAVNISEIEDALGQNVKGDDFWDKWHKQLEACSPNAHKVAADVLVLYELILWPGPDAAMKPETKMANVETVISWKLADQSPDTTWLKDAFDTGCVDPGAFYATRRALQIGFYLQFARAMHEQGVDPTDWVACKELADKLRGKRNDVSAARHILLHLLFPERFEPMLENPKLQVVSAFQSEAGDATDLDEKMLNIRKALSKQLGREDWHYWEDDVMPLWQDGGSPQPPMPDPVLGKIADLLETRTLKDADILTDSGWRKLIIPVTRPFLKSVAGLMNKTGSELKYHTGGDAKTKRDSFDRGRVELEKDGSRWPAGPPTVVIAVGYADEPQNEPNFEKCVAWGFIQWPLVEQASNAYQAIKEFMPDGYDVRLQDGMKSANYPGKNVVAFKYVPAAQLRDYTAQQLASEIAGEPEAAHSSYCRYSEFTWDIPENQVIRQVAHLLSGWGFRRDLRLRLARIDAIMAEVTPTNLTGRAVASFRYNRQNDDYRPLHQLCRLFLDGASLSEDEGTFDFRTFLVDMNKLFEEFITQVLLERARGSVTVAAQESLYLGHEKKVFMRPDILVSDSGTVSIAADCKYKRIQEEEFKNHDMYQVLAYCTAAGVQKGLLIYPRHMMEVDDEVRVRNAGVTIRQKTVDLSKSHSELLTECDTFARFVFDWLAAAAE